MFTEERNHTMSVTFLNSTTLSAAITDQTTQFLVGSTTNITANTSYLVLNEEVMFVTALPVAGTVSVQRGLNGTLARAHAAGEVAYIAVASDISIVQQGNVKVPLRTNDSGTLPRYPFALGTRARDARGNEYVLVDPTESLYSRQPVLIRTGTWTCEQIGATAKGMIGVLAEGDLTSDTWGWAQIYGRTLMQISMGGVSPSDAANGPTTLMTSVHTKFRTPTTLTSPIGLGWASDVSDSGYYVQGMYVASDASLGDVSAVTSAASHSGSQVAVWLNYPHAGYWDGPSTN